jgi:adenylate cyclase
MFERWYLRLGPRYPRAALSAALRFEYLVVAGGALALGLFIPISPGQIALLVGVAVAAQEMYAQLSLRYFRDRMGSVAAWISGPRSEKAAVTAWREAASAPYRLLRLSWRGGYPFPFSFAWSLFAIWLLGEPAWGIPVMYAAVLLVIAYGNVVVFLLLERAMQPILDDIASELSDEVEIEAETLPLRRRLLATLPPITVGVAVLVVGLFQEGEPGLDGLALAIGVSAAIALSANLLFTVLLADSVVSPIRRLESATARVGSGDLQTRVPVSSADETGTLTRAFNRMLSGLQERERLREAFGTFVDPELAERVARDGTDLAGEELEISIMFMDVRGFTAFSERAPAREVVARLNELYEVVVPLITGHGGHANKFIGDGLLAVFGAPERQPDHAERAVNAALAIAEQVRLCFAGRVRVGVGVNSGSVVVGTIGGGGRLDFTVIGDTVNTAARVESATRTTDDDVLITKATLDRLPAGNKSWLERPAMPLKGKSEAVRIYAPAGSSSETVGQAGVPAVDRTDGV